MTTSERLGRLERTEIGPDVVVSRMLLIRGNHFLLVNPDGSAHATNEFGKATPFAFTHLAAALRNARRSTGLIAARDGRVYRVKEG